MSLVQDDHVIQAFATDTPDEPLDVGFCHGLRGQSALPQYPCAAPAAEMRRYRSGPGRAADTAGPRPMERLQSPVEPSTAAVGCSVI